MERLESLGEQAMRATTVAMLAQARAAQGRYDEAAELSEASAREAAPDDVVTQALWRSVQAQVLARRSRHEEAEALAREAVALLAPTDALTDRGDALLTLAEILALREQQADAAAAARRGARSLHPQGSGGPGGPGTVRHPALRTAGQRR